MIVLDDRWQPESMSPGLEDWLRDLPDGNWEASRLPPSLLAVAGRAARAATESDDPAEVAVSRVLTRSGRWVVLHGVPLAAGDLQRVAVIVEPAHPARIAPLLMAAYGLTEREQQLTRLVLQGYSTADIGERLVISVHTVQEHLKKVFDKTGVRSRGELVGQIFLEHYAPRWELAARRQAEPALTDDVSVFVETLDTDIIHRHRAMHNRFAHRFGDFHQLRQQRKMQHIGRQTL